jgi:hypothetical protein
MENVEFCADLATAGWFEDQTGLESLPLGERIGEVFRLNP